MEIQNYIYYIDKDRFILSDLSQSIKSERTIDIPFKVLANHEELLQKLNLVSMYCNSENGTKWFANYLSDFTNKNGMITKLMTNPIIRILILDDALLKTVKLTLGK